MAGWLVAFGLLALVPSFAVADDVVPPDNVAPPGNVARPDDQASPEKGASADAAAEPERRKAAVLDDVDDDPPAGAIAVGLPHTGVAEILLEYDSKIQRPNQNEMSKLSYIAGFSRRSSEMRELLKRNGVD